MTGKTNLYKFIIPLCCVENYYWRLKYFHSHGIGLNGSCGWIIMPQLKLKKIWVISHVFRSQKYSCSLHLTLKNAWIFVLVHYLFLDIQTFAWVKCSQKTELGGTEWWCLQTNNFMSTYFWANKSYCLYIIYTLEDNFNRLFPVLMLLW